jgi:manganese-dependent inorganic pyrophosphatase
MIKNFCFINTKIMSNKIYVIGHKSPDLDSVAAAISYAHYLNLAENTTSYEPRVLGNLNKETNYILEKFNFEKPQILDNAINSSVILVDHNESSQSVDGLESAKILQVLDHHKIDFKSAEPITFDVRPWGSSNTIIADKFLAQDLELDSNMAGLMLAAVLTDTVITKSPTCTQKDLEIIEKLSVIARINDWRQFGMEIFKIRSAVQELPAAEIIRSDFKDFNFKAGKFGIGQVETVDLNEFAGREDELLEELHKIKESENYHSAILFITDILQEGSLFLVATADPAGVEQAFNTKLDNEKVYIEDILSRKKQVVPKLTEIFNK